MARRYDIVIIGAGAAGLPALGKVCKETESFLIINADPYCTTCKLPQIFLEFANARHELEMPALQGILRLRSMVPP